MNSVSIERAHSSHALEAITTPFIVTLPHNPYRNLLIADYINDTHSAFYASTPEDRDAFRLTAQLLTTLTEQGYPFKRVKQPASYTDAGRVIGTALGNSVQSLVLDQFDNIKEGAADWLAGLASTLASGVRVVISSRRMDHAVLRPLLQQGLVTVIGDETFAEQPVLSEQEGSLAVFVLGRGVVWYEGKQVRNWDGPLTRRLFYYLLDRGPANRKQIFETFWPSLPIREATNVFHVTKRKMNETLGIDVTTYSDRHYQVADNIRLYYDVRRFEDALRDADTGYGEESIEHWQNAVKLYRHPFLMEERLTWIVERRRQLQEGYAQALVSLARYYQNKGDGERALNHFLRALIENPMREDLHLQVMHLQADLGNTPAALAQYELLRDRLHANMKLKPGKEAAALYNKLRA